MATEAEKIDEDGGPVDQYVHYSGKVRLAKDLNFEAWSRTLIGFIRHKGLEQELKDWSGGWPCPVGSDPEAPLVYAFAPDLLLSLKDAIDIIEKHVPRDALGVDHMGDFSVPGGVMTWCVIDEHLHYMRKAIAKAEGRS
ncbi:hypothetical protein [Ensifer canadensis]|uniref:hypothetical protein n=1 Tax=Ensifer canadensis TaxID=555315 RepID=UPI0035E3D564